MADTEYVESLEDFDELESVGDDRLESLEMPGWGNLEILGDVQGGADKGV